ncbi:hypothetical protein J6590_004185 [Homalodisca vitripennis]|nr:hypothetical protein J6590_004185 [Homalodisca vitripennis]
MNRCRSVESRKLLVYHTASLELASAARPFIMQRSMAWFTFRTLHGLLTSSNLSFLLYLLFLAHCSPLCTALKDLSASQHLPYFIPHLFFRLMFLCCYTLPEIREVHTVATELLEPHGNTGYGLLCNRVTYDYVTPDISGLSHLLSR